MEKNAKGKAPITILGAGSWGTALALHLARAPQTVHLWTVETDHAEEMLAEKTNRRYLPGYPFPTTLHPILDLQKAIAGVTDILVAVPSAGFRETLQLLKPHLNATHRIVWATKGLDPKAGEFLHQVAKEVLGQRPYAILSGPSFASEVAAGLPTAVVIASHYPDFAKVLAERFNTPRFRVYFSTDLIGVQVGATLKNILAIATGISDGMGFGANARCALITRGLAEMTRFGLALGGQPETFTGLTGLGDLILTASDNQSRNRRFGLAIGQGKNPHDIEKEIGQVVEGKHNAELVLQLASQHQIEMPIIESVLAILQNKLTPTVAMQNLFLREMKAE